MIVRHSFAYWETRLHPRMYHLPHSLIDWLTTAMDTLPSCTIHLPLFLFTMSAASTSYSFGYLLVCLSVCLALNRVYFFDMYTTIFCWFFILRIVFLVPITSRMDCCCWYVKKNELLKERKVFDELQEIVFETYDWFCDAIWKIIKMK